MAGLFGMNNQTMGLIQGLLSPNGGSFTGGLANGLGGAQRGGALDQRAAMAQQRMGLLASREERAQAEHEARQQQAAALAEQQAQQQQAMRQTLPGLLGPDSQAGALMAGGVNPRSAMDMAGKIQDLQPKAEQYTLSPGQVRMQGADVLAQGPEKAPDMNSMLIPDGQGGYKINEMLQQAKIAQRQAGRNNVITNVNSVDTFKNSRDAYKDYRNDKQTDAFNKLRQSHQRIRASLGRGSGAGDVAGVVAFNKMLDPGSVVRESEVAMAMDTSGSLDKMRLYGQRMVTGEKLSPTQRQEFVTLADELMRGVEAEQQRFHGTTRQRAHSFGMDPQRIAPDLPTIDYTSPFKDPPKGQDRNGGGATGSFGLPQAGETVDGYRFKGGDPNDQSNWEKL